MEVVDNSSFRDSLVCSDSIKKPIRSRDLDAHNELFNGC